MLELGCKEGMLSYTKGSREGVLRGAQCPGSPDSVLASTLIWEMLG
jgi:hypothetical protein